MAERITCHDTDYQSKVRRRINGTKQKDISYAKHFLERIKKRDIILPTLKTLSHGKIIEVYVENNEVTKAVIEVVKNKRYVKRFVIAFNDVGMTYITAYTKRKGE